MAPGFLLSHQVRDLALGKPPLPWLPLSSASVSDAIRALKQRDLPEISVWDCSPVSHLLHCQDVDSAIEGSIQGAGGWHWLRQVGECRCVGKVSMQKIVCYLSTDESLSDLFKALHESVSVLLTEPVITVRHIRADASILEALDLIVDGAQNLVVAIENPYDRCSRNSTNLKKIFQRSKTSLQTNHNGRDYCWLTSEDVIRFLLSFVSIFSPLPMMNIEDLRVINVDVLMVEADMDAISALDMIHQASHRMTAVAVVENNAGYGSKLIGEISCSTLRNCDETAALALASLAVRDFLSYAQECKNPPDALLDMVRLRICKKLDAMKMGDRLKTHFKQPFSEWLDIALHSHALELLEESSEEESVDSPIGSDFSDKWQLNQSSKGGYGSRIRVPPIVCRPWSSLVAVILQALTHRENYVWVTQEDSTLVGIATFTEIVALLLNHLNSTR